VKDGISIDLNWGLHEYAKNPEYQKMIEFQGIEIEQVKFNVLSVTINLIHTIIHGAAWNSISSTRWILDAALLSRSSEIDWTLFAEIVIENGWQHPLVDQLNYLSEFEVRIPKEVIQKISESNSDFWGRAMYFYQRQPSRLARRVNRTLYSDYLTYITNERLKNSIFNFIKFQPVVLRAIFTEYLRISTGYGRKNLS
jgi:hypothetical protein